LTSIFEYVNILKVGDIITVDWYFSMPDLTQFKAEFFKALAHPLRIKILDSLRNGECGVNELCSRVGAEQSTLSQQLALLRARNIVVPRKNGNNVYYSVKDGAVFRLLDVARDIFNNQLIDFTDLLSQLQSVSSNHSLEFGPDVPDTTWKTSSNPKA
jgi:DNA-binding transcriptional ArsR family regulator